MDRNNNIIVDFLNVGFGECVVVRQIGQHPYTVIIDGGDDRLSIYNKNPNRIQLLTYLEKEEINKIDLLIMTHPHRDHIGGLEEVVRSFKVMEAWYTFKIPSKKIPSSNQELKDNMRTSLEIYYFIINHLHSQGTKLKVISTGFTYQLGELNIEVFSCLKENMECLQQDINILYETEDASKQQELLNEIDKSLNACSVVLGIQAYDTKILLTSDILLSYWVSIHDKVKLRADILKLPHHGDTNHLSETLLELIKPTYAVVCADNEGTYQLPSYDIEQYVNNVLPHTKIFYSAEKKNELVDGYRGIRCIINSNRRIQITKL